MVCRSEKKYTWNLSKILSIFYIFFINFYENIHQELNLLSEFTFAPFTYVCCKNCISAFSVFVLNLSKFGNILFRNCQLEIDSSASLSLVAERTLWCINFVWVMAAAELHVNITYAQDPALKLLDGKDQSVIVRKLFSS